MGSYNGCSYVVTPEYTISELSYTWLNVGGFYVQ